MKLFTTPFALTVLLTAFVLGCGDGTPKKSTDGADAQAIADYEAAVAATEQQNVESGVDKDQ
ncbi:hypothetical protein [Stieleria varia]|uniref:Uncharacterized protein n=1 Tax=Stieleria varia TaxID=2528005 RepID=A0A5C5ZYJ1_9BACT|nr:hypothetical protein [Stieleria varia]TWT92037.1 hypothetical protein Pla52n_63330 [Stieleria varia]